MSYQSAVRLRRHRVAAHLSRSWLLVPAHARGKFAAATASAADQVVLDLEDGVPVSQRDQARTEVCRWLDEGNAAWVRINVRGTDDWGLDLSALAHKPALLGVVLPKVESPQDVAETVRRLPGIPLVALIESALGIEEAVAIARAEGVTRLAFGSGDYRRDTGVSADPLAMAYPRSRLVVASRIGGLPGPVDGPTVGSDAAVLLEHTRTAASLGMTGRLCLSAGQAPVVNETLSPSPEEVEWARGVIAQSLQSDDSSAYDGSALPRLGRAERVVTLADAFALG